MQGTVVIILHKLSNVMLTTIPYCRQENWGKEKSSH